jgi:hypothetical protein
MKILIPLALVVALAGCSDASKQRFQARVDTISIQAAKVKQLAPAYCKARPETVLDDMVLAAIALAASEGAADTIKSGVDKLCEWAGVPA